jgi:hypothetical protein
MKPVLFAQLFGCLALAASAAAAQQTLAPVAERVQNPTGRDQAIKLINNGLAGLDRELNIKSCPLIMSSQKAKFETIYGGYCILNNDTKIVVCADSGLGQFALTEIVSTKEADVTTFMDHNCPGG